jgi:uncharacterized protein (DUF433 family)
LLEPGLQLDLPRARRAYKYDDLGAIVLIRELRGRGLSMRCLRNAVAWFAAQVRGGERWASRRIWTDGKDQFVFEPEQTSGDAAAHRGRSGCSIFLPDLVEGLLGCTDPALRALARHVEIRPDVQAGQPVIRNTRLTTALIAGIAGPEVELSLVRDVYPDLTPDEIEAAVGFEKALGRLAA